MIDQSHNVEGKIDAMIQSVMNIQTAYAKALLVDEERLAARSGEGDVLGAHRVLLDAFETDVRPLLARLRAELGVEDDPVAAFRDERPCRAASRGSAARPRSRAPTSGTDDRASDADRPLRHLHRRHACSRRSRDATVQVLERLGHEVVFPAEQTCCGQMHLNSGYRDEARGSRDRFVDDLRDFEAVVSPSSSCVGTRARARVGHRDNVFELSELLVAAARRRRRRRVASRTASPTTRRATRCA